MINLLKKHLHYHFHHPNYLFFFIILILVIVIPPFAALISSGMVFIEILFGLVIFTGALYASSSTKDFIIGLAIGGTGFLLYVLNRGNSVTLGLMNAFFIFIFFQFILWKVVDYVLKTKEVDVNAIFACISGYLILGIGAAPLFLLIHELIPGAFNIKSEVDFYEFTYFSFITVTTIGYGDITPNSPIAKSLTLLIGIAGQLYLTFLVAIIIGKYLAGTNEKIN